MFLQEHLSRFAARAAAGIVAVAALASCGGGTYQVNAFVPARVLVFGDESSSLTGPQGLKYAINGVSTISGQVDCTLFPIWTQTLANSYGLVFSNCNPDASNQVDAIDLTKLNGTVDDTVQAVAAFQAGDTFNGNDLVTIWVGMHDILNEYQLNGTGTDGDETTLLSDMKSQGQTLGNLVNSIAAAGGKVLLLTVYDQSETPFAFTESQRGDFDRGKLLSDMTTSFNLGLRSTIINDGSQIGLVLVDDLIRNDTRSPGSFGLIANDNQSFACLSTSPLPNCTNLTLNNDPATGQPATQGFLWADATHLATIAQSQIGTQAVNRARSNPF